jgi:hypothetical protein
MKTLPVILLFVSAIAGAQDVKTAECFPIEKLPKELQPRAQEYLQKMLESEALLTLVSDLKPMSSGWSSLRIEVTKAPVEEIDTIHTIFSALRCGNEIECVFAPFTRVYEGKRFLDGFVFNRATLKKKITEQRDIFGFFGITPAMPPASILGLIDGEETPERSRAYGHLFGYPTHAVNFFVDAETSQRATGKFVERDFWTVPVFGGKENRFVYAVPKGHVPNEIDQKFKSEIPKYVDEYTRRRPKYIREGGKLDAVALLRDWYKGKNGRCSPQNALIKN